MRLAAFALLLVGLAACTVQRPPPTAVEIVAGPAQGELAPAIVAELARARDDGRTLLVYVGATWCEPCRYFHQAVLEGRLNAYFPTIRLVEFDLDRDRERLNAAGYGTPMIPLLVVPSADGRGTERRMAGSIKGPGAVAEMVPRLRELLASAPR